MTNAAYELARILDIWKPEGNQPTASRRQGVIGGRSDGPKFWAAHLRAVRLLVEIDVFLSQQEAAGEDTAGLRAASVYWYQAVFAYTTEWRHPSTNTQLIARPHLDHLQTLGLLMDASSWRRSDAPEVDQLDERLAEVQELLDDAEDLPAAFTGYLHVLIQSAQDAVRDYRQFGRPVDRSVEVNLGGAVILVSHAATGQTSEWRDRAGKLALRLLAGTGNAATAGRIGALTPLAIGFVGDHI
jgi:hypothetical protein